MAKDVKEIARGKLTKKFLNELPTNSYLVSNVGYDKYTPMYENRVVAASKRENQWHDIKQASVNNRLCYAFSNKTEYKKWKSQLYK